MPELGYGLYVSNDYELTYLPGCNWVSEAPVEEGPAWKFSNFFMKDEAKSWSKNRWKIGDMKVRKWNIIFPSGRIKNIRRKS